MKKLLLPLLLAVAMFGSANIASADPFVLELSTVVTGSTPGGSTPYLSLEFEDLGGGVVEVTFNAVNLELSEYATEWNFNLDPTLDPDDLDIDFVSGIEASSFDTQENGFSAAAGSANYDIQFFFPTGSVDKLGPDGDFATYTFTLAGLTAASFNFTNAADPNGPYYYTMAHIQGVGERASDSSWVAAEDGFSDNEDPEDPPAVPEPASIALLGVGGAVLLARRYFVKK